MSVYDNKPYSGGGGLGAVTMAPMGTSMGGSPGNDFLYPYKEAFFDVKEKASSAMTSLGDFFGQVFGSGKSVNDPSMYWIDGEPSPIQYFDAPYAEKYGMSAETAYSEALANTAHQREVADLKAAGLNPVLSATRGAGADVVSGSSGSAGVSFGTGGSAKETTIFEKAFPWVAGAVVTAISKNASLGYSARGLAKALLDE